MLHYEIIRRCFAQNFGNMGQPRIGEVGIHRVHNGGLFVPDQVRVIRHTAAHAVLPLKQIDLVVVDANICNVLRDFHVGIPPMLY